MCLSPVSVSWHHSTTNKIQSIHPHPSGSSFAVFEEPDSAESQITRISLFTLRSPQLTKVYTLPFTLRSKAWYTDATQPFQYSFLGINQSWSLIAFGDSVDLTREDTSAKELSTDMTSRKPTLLQDIFGSSAFVDLTNSSPSGSDQAQYQVPMSSKSAEAIFDTPAYLTPALNTFYDSLVHTFLKRRIVEDLSPSDVSKMDIDEDDKVEDDDEPQVRRSPPTRAIPSSEVNDLIGLFRKHAIQGDP